MSHMTRAELSRDGAVRTALARLLIDQGETDCGHRLVWTLFADDPDSERDFIFREAEPGRYLIVSARLPSDAQGLWRLDTKDYAPALQAGQRFGFTLRANPAIAVKKPGAERSQRVDAVMHAKTKAAAQTGVKQSFDAEAIEQAALPWLFARAPALGVEFVSELCSAGGYRQIRIPQGKAQSISFSVIDYEGVLVVTDPDRIAHALTKGVGKARAYGCGLLLLRPLGG